MIRVLELPLGQLVQALGFRPQHAQLMLALFGVRIDRPTRAGVVDARC